MNEFLAGLIGRATQRGVVLERRPRSRFEPVAHRGPAAIELDGAARAATDDLDGDAAGADGVAGDPSRAVHREPAAGRAPAGMPPLDHAPELAALALRSPGPPGSPAVPSGPARRARADSVVARRGAPEDALDAEPAPVAGLEPGLAARSTASASILLRPIDRLAPARPDAFGPESSPPAPPHPPVRAVAAPPALRPSPRDPAAVAPPAAPSGSTPPAARDGDAQPVRSAAPVAPALRAIPALVAPRAAGSLARALPAPIVRSAVDRGPRSNGPAALPPAPVHVTIGRIEVRTTAPAADRPPVRRPAPQPRLSLEAYLSGRRGGAR